MPLTTSQTVKTMKKINHWSNKVLYLVVFLIGCTALKYTNDLGFINSSKANSFEAPLNVGTKPCKDIHGRVGLCVTHVKQNQPLILNMPARPYSYQLVITCPIELEQSKTYSIPKEKKFSVEIKDYKGLDFFHCIGEIFPDDRDWEVSAKWGIFVKVVNADYLPRETTFKYQGYIVMGSHARYTTVCYKSGSCKNYKNLTTIKDTKNTVVSAFSESEQMRFNYYVR